MPPGGHTHEMEPTDAGGDVRPVGHDRHTVCSRYHPAGHAPQVMAVEAAAEAVEAVEAAAEAVEAVEAAAEAELLPPCRGKPDKHTQASSETEPVVSVT